MAGMNVIKLLCLTLVLGSYSNAFAQIVFEKRKINFGPIPRGKVINHEFRFTNQGVKPAKISGIHSSCGCIVSQDAVGRLYQPGESGVLNVAFDTSDFTGKTKQSLYVLTGRRGKKSLGLFLQANIVSPIDVQPPIFYFENLPVGERVSAQAMVKSLKPGLTVKLKQAPEGIDVDFTELDSTTWKVTMGFARKTSKEIRKLILLETNDENLPLLKVPVISELGQVISISPQYIEFGFVKDHKEMNLKLADDRPFKIVNSLLTLKVGDELVSPREVSQISLPPNANNQQNVKIRLKNSGKYSGPLHGTLELLTDNPAQKELVIRLYGIFEKH